MSIVDEGVIGEEQDNAEEQELLSLVPDQGEDESDPTDDATTFTASIAGKDWTVETLVSQMRKGRIDLSPSFQRRNAWLNNRKSKLIESILLGFPIPQIVLAEQRGKPGYYFVLDGKQRLLAMRQFFADPTNPQDDGFDTLTIGNLEVLTELNHFHAASLERKHPEYLAALENHTIRTVVLGQWNSERLLLSLFLRLNTGSVQLSPQELRQALIPGQFISWLDKTSGELKSLKTLLGNTHPDRRMVDAELLLRHLSFSTSPIPYRGNLKQFLDDTSRIYNEGWTDLEADAHDALYQFDAALTAAVRLFGINVACRKWSGTKYERALNRAVFDVQIFSLSLPHVREQIEGCEHDVLGAYRRTCVENEAFLRSITTTTKTADAFTTRHRQWAKILHDECDIDYPLPASLRRD